MSVIHTVYSYLAIELYIDQHASEYQHIIIVIYWLNDKKKDMDIDSTEPSD